MEISVSRDIRKYKTKDIGNFSFKEAGWIASAMAVAFVTYRLTKSIEYSIIPLAIILVVGFLKPYGMSVITFLRTVGKEKLTTQCYIYETDFEYEPEEIQKLYGTDISTEWNVIQTNTAVKINKEDKKRIIR